METLRENSGGEDVRKLQKRLEKLGFSPGATDGDFGPATKAALIAFQKSEGLLADGVAGPKTLRALGLTKNYEPESALPKFTVKFVARMFPFSTIDNIRDNLPFVLEELAAAGLKDERMILMALATIRAESESFEPVSEGKSRFNTSPGKHPFNLYDNRKDLGNRGKPDVERFRGRGFVQLTGRANYKTHGERIGLDDLLVENPEMANDPRTAAKLLASFLKNKELTIKKSLLEADLKTARRLVNGGSHGLDRFEDAFERGRREPA